MICKAKHSDGKTVGQRIALVLIAIAVVIVAHFVPCPEGLSYPGKMAIAFMLSGIILWVTEPIPMAISGLAIMVSLPIFGILPYLNITDRATGAITMGVWGGFISSVIFFILASFGITAALLKTKIPSKLVFSLMRLTKGNAKATVGVFMLASAVLSFLISDLPCTALFSGIAASSILKVQEEHGGSTRLGKALMIGITYASVVGGQAIPSGSAMNVMAMNVLEGSTGIHISFLDWTQICLPLTLVLLLACWVSLVLVFKPEPISKETQAKIQEACCSVGKFDALDYKVMAIILITFATWIASNWTGWDITAIAVLSMSAFFLPGIDVLNWKEYMASVSWNIVLLIGCVQSIAEGVKQQGAASWIFASSVGKIAVSGTMIVAASAVFLPLLRLICPVGPAFIAISLIPLAGMATSFGVSPVVFTIIVAVNASTTFLMGVDGNNMLSYRHGYWNMIDFAKAGIIPTIVMVLLHAFVLAPLVGLVGY